MKRYIAIPYDKEQIFHDFDDCKEFIIYSFEERFTLSATVVGIIENSIADINNTRLRFLLQNNVRTVICDKISYKSKEMLGKFDIRVIEGISGSAEKAFEVFKHGELQSK